MKEQLPSKTLSISEGELWSLVRSLISQGTAIQMDAHAGKYPTSEHVFARIDEAARERSDEIVSKYSAHEPSADLYSLLVRRGYAQHEAHAIAFGDKLAVLSSSEPPRVQAISCMSCGCSYRDINNVKAFVHMAGCPIDEAIKRHAETKSEGRSDE